MKKICSKIIITIIAIFISFLFVSCKKEINYNITYQLNGGRFTEKVITNFTNENIPTMLPIPVKNDHNFISWTYNNQEVKDFSFLGKEENITLKAKWEKIKPYLSKDYLNIGDEVILYAPGHFDDSNLNIEISSDVITIDKWLNVKAEKLGVATITISEKNNPTVITTIDVEVISKNPLIKTVTNQTSVGEEIYFNISNFPELKENNLNEFKWSISNENIGVITDNFSVKGLAQGEVTLTATSIYDERITSSITLKIVDPNENIVLSTENKRYIYKQGEVFKISMLGSQKDKEFVWSSSNLEVIRIIENGTIVSVNPGQATINVYEKGKPNNSAYYEFTIIENDKDVDYIGNLLTLAFSQVGYKEGPNNDQKYGIWYNNNYEPWCAMFVSWCWYHTGLSNDILLKYQGCGTGEAWCIEKGIFHYKADYTPKPGDIIFFTSAGMGHTGICAYVEGDYMYTIEGNSSDKVGIWRWSLKDARITGYASPEYPEYNGTVKDFSFLAGKDESGKYYWTNVSEKQDVE